MRPPKAVSIVRVVLGLAVIGLLIYLYLREAAAGAPNPFDFFGYFTNQTSLLACAALICTGVRSLAGRAALPWLASVRAVTVACMIIVAVIYNTLVPGTGSAPAWASAILHIVFPAWVLIDWAVVPDRGVLPWRRLWIVLPYPLLWMAVVLTRGATDGWVPYGFLLPEHGAASLMLHMAGLLLALVVAATAVWGLSRLPSPSLTT
ncbi:hypothetical protein JOF28_002670 [Leucobacter exalbidus]|uniref:FAR-17a/AIG1-like protein n=1 Tax=Leucobacter exalbidus TaxID=662960 RepID=A0A940T4Y3_9MICO|nr:Pr6Pr family membrane protein [Leucobacter exalbidus]MBP1327438.1 hypothetical protein [Leucobacter exalbidus]